MYGMMWTIQFVPSPEFGHGPLDSGLPSADPAVGKKPVRVVVVVDGQADLLEVVRALHPVGGLADLLDRGQQQADQDGDDGDHHQQLDQREADSKFPGLVRGMRMFRITTPAGESKEGD